MFVVLEGSGTLRVAGEMLPVDAGDVVFIPAGPDYPHQMINTSGAPRSTCQSARRSGPRSASIPTPGRSVPLPGTTG
jgi:uncharacterized cupin superfamily protein